MDPESEDSDEPENILTEPESPSAASPESISIEPLLSPPSPLLPGRRSPVEMEICPDLPATAAPLLICIFPPREALSPIADPAEIKMEPEALPVLAPV
jgi:hypothetical protein